MAGNPCNIIPDQEIVLEGGAKLVPAPEAADAGKVLGVINQEGGIGWVEDQSGTLVQQQANWAESDNQSVSFIQNKPTIPTVDQTYNASSTNAQSGTAVAEALGSSSTLAAGNGVSLTESSGTLTVAADVDNVTIGFDSTTHKIKSLQTVDQTYDAASSNAQSGAAVAQAIAAIPSSSYTSGDGIDITNNEISVNYDTNTLSTVYGMSSVNMTLATGRGNFRLPEEIQALAASANPSTVTIHIPANTLYLRGHFGPRPLPYQSIPLRIMLGASDYIPQDEDGGFSQFESVDVACTYDSDNDYTWVDEQDITIPLPCDSQNGWSSDIVATKFTICADVNYADPYSDILAIETGTTISNPIVFSYEDASAPRKLAVKNPLPASTSADENKVLTVDNQGNPAWATPDEGIDVVTASGNFKIGGSVPVKVNYTAGSSEYERGPLQLVNTLDGGSNYAVAMFKVVGSQNIYSGTFGSATLTINEAMDIAGTGNSDLTIAFSDSASEWSTSRYLYRDSFTRTDGKIVAQSLNFWNATPYDTGSYIGVGIKVANGPDVEEQVAAVLQQLANGAVSISNWPVEQVMVTEITNIPAFTSADAGRVLQVQNDGTLAWVTLS